ncbi:MAG: carboxy terminal-processing peptidase [Pirellulaceae bacterium]|nr:carboxy terminal-processing peptidase [Pirellulaceae bacterium]
MNSSEDFAKVLRNIARYNEQKARKSVTLNEEKFMKERAELNADKETEKVLEKQLDLDNGRIERDFYLDEVLALTVDYMNLRQQDAIAQGALGAKQ